MQYIILAFFIILAFTFFYKIVIPSGDPDFMLKSQLTDEKLFLAISDLARKSRLCKSRGKGLSLKTIKKYITRAYKNISKRIAAGEECLEFENWIYDNYYKLSERMSSIKGEIHKFCFLPHYGDLPRVYDFMQLLVKSCDGYITDELLKKATDVYNAETPLSFAEIMALKPALEFALLEYVAIFASKSITLFSLAKKAKADAAKEKIDLSQLRFNGYVSVLFSYGSARTRKSLSALCLDNGADISSRLDGFATMTARYNAQMQSAVRTLFELSLFMNAQYVLELSPTHAMLSSEAGICYNETMIGTKYFYMKHIYRSAYKKKISELALTREIIQAAQRDNRDISFYILPKKCHPKTAYIYILLQVLITAALSFSVTLLYSEYYIALSLLSIPIFFVVSGMILGFICKGLFSRRELPSYDVKNKNRDEIATLITTSRLIATVDEVDDAFRNMETVICANGDDFFSYCLLFDLLADKMETNEEKDAPIIKRCKERFEASEFKDRITLLLRRREKVEGKEEKYQGWEKKRGALIQLNRLILQRDEKPFALVLGSVPRAKYVITLDSDTLSNSCRALVELMEHPYNADANVVSVNMNSCVEEDGGTLFSRFFQGSTGLDGYRNYSQDTEFDLWGSGNYTGKGIYRVSCFHEKVSGAFGDNRILSHDYIEGAFAGCGLSRETALDSFPKNFSAYLTRSLRWLRGDWQLLPYLKRKVKDGSGEKMKNPISPINKWHIFSNMMFSLSPIASMLLIFLSLFMSVPAYICLLAFLLPEIYFLLSVRASVISSRPLWAEELVRQVFNIVVLPVTAFFNLYSIVLTIVRLITKKGLLEWQVFAHAKGRISFVPNFITAVILVASAAIYERSAFFYIISAVFLLGYFADVIMSKPCPRKRYDSKELNDKLKEIFGKTYDYFAEMLIKENNYLPCDNYQEFENVGWIRRTSPTNIGYALLAHICAYEMGFITLEESLIRCEKIVGAVEKLPKHNGNLYNWYDITALEALPTKYVSSVDCGNLLAALQVVKSYCNSNKMLALRVERLIEQSKIEELFDEKRGLFRIGYNAETCAFDTNHYDLIGSESSLTYLTAISLGRTRKYAWSNLSKRGAKYGKRKMYYSWTGGVFEHLMCPQFYTYCRGTDLYKSARAVTHSHMVYAAKNKLPFWGISESQYGTFDNAKVYQYKAFGVPQISLSNQGNVSVVSPYASLMALEFAPGRVHENIAAMEKFGMGGKFGFFESWDGDKNTVQQAYMTHHQGMILMSICNYLHKGAVRNSAARLPQVRAAELLLSQSTGIDAQKKIKMPKIERQTKKVEFTVCGRHRVPHVNLLSSGKFSLVTDENGGGYSLFGDTFLFGCDNRGCGEKLFMESDGNEYDLLGGKFTAGADSSVYEKRVGDFAATVEISVLPLGAGSIKNVRLTNLSDETKDVKIKTYASLVLGDRHADIAHPAYSGMFVETAYDKTCDVITARRVNAAAPLIAAHFISCDCDVSYTTSRHNYFGRGVPRPDFGRTLDPIFSGSFSPRIEPKGTICFSVYTLVGETQEKVKESVHLTRVCGYSERIKGNGYALAKSEKLGQFTKKTAAAILFGSAGSLRDPIVPFRGRPIVALEVKSENSVERLKKQLTQLKKLYKFGIEFDLYIIYSEKHNYFLYISELINEALDELSYRKDMNGKSSITLLNSVSDERLASAVLASSVGFSCDFSEIDENAQTPKKPLYKNAGLQERELAVPLGLGGFLDDGSYFMDISSGDTPAPWSNIIANESFGTIITESGGGYTFADNSREKKISRWCNDDVLDTPSEFVVLGESGTLWSITKKPIKTNSSYHVIHSFGYSEFSNDYNGIVSSQRVYISKDNGIKFYDITLKNTVAQERKIDIMFAIKPVLGDFGSYTESAISVTKQGNFIVVSNAATSFSAYLSCSERITGFSGYAEAFTDTNGKITKITNLGQEGSDIFASLTTSVTVGAGSEKRIIFSVSTTREVEFADCDYIFSSSSRYYGSLSSIVPTKIDAHGALMKWLPYQALCSRFFARAGFYQAGGAYGFRDQLQDCLSLLYIDPSLVKKHILRCASHQFEHGDVQHWWHPPAIGVRTNICDDRLFLPYITAEYIAFTHDYGVLDERVPYLLGAKMQAGESSVYASCAVSNSTESLLEHCLKAIYCTFDYGENGLIKMRGGDWNDAMDKVGERGYGTSVFMSMFLCFVIDKFLPHVNNSAARGRLIGEREKLRKALTEAWDGDRFIRAVTDDNEVLGSSNSPECKIDLLVQSWAALSGIVDEKYYITALKTAQSKLVDEEIGIIKLLDPPLKNMKNIGYITQYPEGIRENGGQYTHAAVWFIMALIKGGFTDEAWKLFNMISPVSHSDTAAKAREYALEPYVIAADIYSGDLAGRGGWSWYTGAASWYYVCLVRGFLGLEIAGNRLTLTPSLPASVDEFSFDYHFEHGIVNICIDNSSAQGQWRAVVGKIVYGSNEIELNKSLAHKKVIFKRIK